MAYPCIALFVDPCSDVSECLRIVFMGLAQTPGAQRRSLRLRATKPHLGCSKRHNVQDNHACHTPNRASVVLPLGKSGRCCGKTVECSLIRQQIEPYALGSSRSTWSAILSRYCWSRCLCLGRGCISNRTKAPPPNTPQILSVPYSDSKMSPAAHVVQYIPFL